MRTTRVVFSTSISNVRSNIRRRYRGMITNRSIQFCSFFANWSLLGQNTRRNRNSKVNHPVHTESVIVSTSIGVWEPTYSVVVLVAETDKSVLLQQKYQTRFIFYLFLSLLIVMENWFSFTADNTSLSLWSQLALRNLNAGNQWDSTKWSMIVRVSELLNRTETGPVVMAFDNLSGSHHDSQVIFLRNVGTWYRYSSHSLGRLSNQL